MDPSKNHNQSFKIHPVSSKRTGSQTKSNHNSQSSLGLESNIIQRNTSKCSNSRYLPVGKDPVQTKLDPIPKGHSAVYVGKKDGDFHRVLVPIVYFNHPLFGELLREAEEEFGFCQEGGITIPCPYSDFKRVQTRIESGSGLRKLSWIRRRQ